MAIFNIFKKKQEPAGPETISETASFIQKRRHQRYDVRPSDLCTLEVGAPHGGSIRLRNISHFGCLTDDLPQTTLDKLTLPAMAKVTVAGRMQTIEITSLSKRSGGVGISFRHASVEALQGMSELILPLQWGVSATFLGEEPSSNNPSLRRLKFRGEGQFDLIVECDASDEVQFLMGTFMMPGGHYVSVIWDGKSLTTKKTVNLNDPSARMAKTETLDQHIVHMCAAACLGIKRPVTDNCAILLCRLAKS
ncbi:MAG: hypothetical protein WCL28_08095 [bacterium]